MRGEELESKYQGAQIQINHCKYESKQWNVSGTFETQQKRSDL